MCVCHLYTIRHYTILHVYCVCVCVCVCVLDIEDLNMMQLDLQVIFLRIEQNKMFEVKGCWCPIDVQHSWGGRKRSQGTTCWYDQVNQQITNWPWPNPRHPKHPRHPRLRLHVEVFNNPLQLCLANDTEDFIGNDKVCEPAVATCNKKIPLNTSVTVELRKDKIKDLQYYHYIYCIHITCVCTYYRLPSQGTLKKHIFRIPSCCHFYLHLQLFFDVDQLLKVGNTGLMDWLKGNSSPESMVFSHEI